MSDRTGMLGCCLALIVGIALMSLAYVSCDIASLESDTFEYAIRSIEHDQPSLSPSLVKKNPLAVLALDMSGSMQNSDADFSQYEALATFLRIYEHISVGATDQGVHPKVALVLYSSVARTISLNGLSWMELRNAADVDSLLARVAPIIGRLGSGGGIQELAIEQTMLQRQGPLVT